MTSLLIERLSRAPRQYVLKLLAQVVSEKLTRSPQIGEARRNGVPLDLKISADILFVISGNLALNHGRIIRVSVGLDGLVLSTFMQYSVAFCSFWEIASDVISTIFMSHVKHDDAIIFRDPGLNRSREISFFKSSETVFAAIFSAIIFNRNLRVVTSFPA